jgi:DNA-binding phage protein
MSAMQSKKRLRPSWKLLNAVKRLGGVNGASREWRIARWTLERWLSGKGGITTDTMLDIESGSGLTQEEAFIRK